MHVFSGVANEIDKVWACKPGRNESTLIEPVADGYKIAFRLRY
jgi:hypothetical protein